MGTGSCCLFTLGDASYFHVTKRNQENVPIINDLLRGGHGFKPKMSQCSFQDLATFHEILVGSKRDPTKNPYNERLVKCLSRQQKTTIPSLKPTARPWKLGPFAPKGKLQVLGPVSCFTFRKDEPIRKKNLVSMKCWLYSRDAYFMISWFTK